MQKAVRRALVAASLLVGIGAVVAVAQTAPGPGPGMAAMGMHHPMDPAKMQAFFDKRMDKLKTVLQLTPEQEGAWTAFKTALTPPAAMPDMPKHDELEKMTTPERLDRLHALRVQRDQRMDQREAATKTFYAALTPPQRKAFDVETLELLSPHRRMRWLAHFMHRGDAKQ